MIRALPPLIAYREDLDRFPGRETFGSFDGVWLAMAHVLEFLSGLAPHERPEVAANFGRGLVEMLSAEMSREDGQARSSETLSGLADVLVRSDEAAANERIAEACLRVIEEITDTGADLLSFSALLHTRMAFADITPRLLGRLLTQQGRVARQYGDLATAQDFFDAVVGLAHENADAEIEARGLYGAAGIALMRGNHPAARQQYEAALQAASRAQSEELIGLAHRGLLVIHATAGEFESALVHGGEALRRSPPSATSHAELLANLAAVCSDVGHHEAALAAYTAASRLGAPARVTLPCLGGAAQAAARLGRRNVLRVLARRIDERVQTGAPPYESATVLLDLATAHQLCGDARALEYAQRARALANEHQFFEMQYAADQILAGAPTPADVSLPLAPGGFSDSSRAVLDSIAMLSEEDCDDRLAGVTME